MTGLTGLVVSDLSYVAPHIGLGRQQVRTRLAVSVGLVIAVILIMAACGGDDDEDSGSDPTADDTTTNAPTTAIGNADSDSRCEELLPARVVADTAGQPLILFGATAEELSADDPPWQLLCGYVDPGVAKEEFLSDPRGPVTLYYGDDPDPSSVENYDQVVEVGGLPAGLIETGSTTDAILWVVGSALGVQIEVDGLDGAAALATQLGEQVAPELGS